MASPNLWKDFLGYFPQSPTLVALVVSLRSDGRTSVVQFPNGSQIIAQGQQVAATNYAFVRGGEIIGPAPAVVPTTIDV